MKDRFMLFILFAGVLVTLGLLIGHWATTEVQEGLAQILAVAP